MHAGTQNQTKTDADLEVHAQLGIEHVCSNPPGTFRGWDVDVLSQYREKVESYGISLDMFELPVPDYHGTQAVIRGDEAVLWNVYDPDSPERDGKIDQICEVIRNASRAGIPGVKYNFSLIGGLRTKSARGRGGAALSDVSLRRPRPSHCRRSPACR